MRLDEKVVVVTGGFGQLGQATARVVLGLGAKVAMLDAAPPPALEFDATRCMMVGGVDLSDPGQAAAAMERVASTLGPVHGLVNIAGTFRWETVADGDPATWDFLYKVNVRTALVASKAVLPHLASSGGRIISIGAGAANRAGLGMGAYAASKAGVARLTESLAEELKDKGITVNAVLPSIIDTPQNRKDMPDADFSRWVKAEDIGQVIAFLLSDLSQAVTGALIPVSGRV
ncbi:SDR family NAD(P)-dependent oxidoreductase [Noviherbaspirillum galbum]|uniref:SDR family NAD(P)-dependent oxidoreductase n=1 Tax=Noviherbaspirillum galbum TaxID=2709383 RepID=A0A6B3SN86_9BURK|nr:SDR family NAD(P)-dependent oxidoreductase [Noviherbaspirillum galbum]NEX62223.1 SDR family NAD(P)-dependent oxidoreductase [Noviherbaspirillum galbum]